MSVINKVLKDLENRTSQFTPIDITALVALPDGSEFLRDSICGPGRDAARLGHELAERLLVNGARDLLERSEVMNV